MVLLTTARPSPLPTRLWNFTLKTLCELACETQLLCVAHTCRAMQGSAECRQLVGTVPKNLCQLKAEDPPLPEVVLLAAFHVSAECPPKPANAHPMPVLSGADMRCRPQQRILASWHHAYIIGY